MIITILLPLALLGVLGLAAVVLVHELAEIVVIANGVRAGRVTRTLPFTRNTVPTGGTDQHRPDTQERGTPTDRTPPPANPRPAPPPKSQTCDCCPHPDPAASEPAAVPRSPLPIEVPPERHALPLASASPRGRSTSPTADQNGS